MRLPCHYLLTAGIGVLLPAPAAAQVILDRADPTITERALPTVNPSVPRSTSLPTTIADEGEAARSGVRITPQAIIVTGSELPPTAFADVIVGYVGRELARGDLSALVSAVAQQARRRGYPLATAAIDPQSLEGGVLRIRLDDGRIDAVRVVGANSARADRLLSRMLATGKPVRQAQLERAILLVGDLPGMTVRESRLSRQDGFNILLVTIEIDRASAYAQIDNRGSEEVGPIRSTVIASVRDLFRSGDEAGLLLANTPLQPTEFAFVRGRYTTPLGPDGGSISVAGSYGRSNPGASLRDLDVIGTSIDGAVTIAQPVLRRRLVTLVASAELRHLESRQAVLGTRFRRDRLDLFTAALDGAVQLGAGTVRGQVNFVAGLPFGAVTREGDPLASRSDGDARFATLGFAADWTLPLMKRTSIVFASAGQVASRALLATAEIGVGGPSFARGYDFAERTGDDGIMASAEARYDMGSAVAGIITRSQIYAFVDGGKVSNRGRRGRGGGSLASSGAGIRFGSGRTDAMVELAYPLNADRLDTGDRSPRFSFRLSRAF